MFRDTHCLSGGPRFNKKVHCKLQSHYFGFCFPFPKTLMFKSNRGFFKMEKLYFLKKNPLLDLNINVFGNGK